MRLSITRQLWWYVSLRCDYFSFSHLLVLQEIGAQGIGDSFAEAARFAVFECSGYLIYVLPVSVDFRAFCSWHCCLETTPLIRPRKCALFSKERNCLPYCDNVEQEVGN